MDNANRIETTTVDDIYAESGHWHVNTGEEKIHAKRMPGRYRTLKKITGSFWLVFFLGPYLQWDGRQAVLFDIPNRQFHLFGATILPQDFWMLSLLLLFFAILLAVVTAVAGRVFCGFFCFQTVWTDVFTWIEEKLEGVPQKRKKLDEGPLTAKKFKAKATKHILWLLISVATGISFTAWFQDAFQLWHELFTFTTGFITLGFIAMFTAGTYLLAGFMREQTCFWLCPYAKIQGVMIDKTTMLPTYDFNRGEPRGRLRKGVAEEDRTLGDCVDCNQCVAVCPTGIDIRNGQQEGCITCALCLDACDSIMEKIGRPTGLIRYESLEGLEGEKSVAIHKRPRVWVYAVILLFAWSGIMYGLASLDSIDLKVLHNRQPLFVTQSDGSIQNKYTLKMLNKLEEPITISVSTSGVDGIESSLNGESIELKPTTLTAHDVFLKLPKSLLTAESVPVVFEIEGVSPSGKKLFSERESFFYGPK